MQINYDLDPKKFKIGVVGGGSWGTALANLLASKGYAIKLWVFEKEVKDQILETGENKVFLPDVKLSAELHPTNDIAEAVLGKKYGGGGGPLSFGAGNHIKNGGRRFKRGHHRHGF